MTPIPVSRHVSYGFQDLAYEPGDPKGEGFVDEITDLADRWADE